MPAPVSTTLVIFDMYFPQDRLSGVDPGVKRQKTKGLM